MLIFLFIYWMCFDGLYPGSGAESAGSGCHGSGRKQTHHLPLRQSSASGWPIRPQQRQISHRPAAGIESGRGRGTAIFNDTLPNSARITFLFDPCSLFRMKMSLLRMRKHRPGVRCSSPWISPPRDPAINAPASKKTTVPFHPPERFRWRWRYPALPLPPRLPHLRPQLPPPCWHLFT